MKFEVTQSAVKRIEYLMQIQQEDCVALRISVQGGGCSGFAYKYEFVSEIMQDDYVLDQKPVKIVIDKLSQDYMSGCVLDFTEELGKEYFNIKNPNASGKCGCGNSFAV